MIKTVLILFIILLPSAIMADGNGTAVPYTLEDRDRLIQLQADIKSMNEKLDINLKSIDQRFDNVNQRFDNVDQRFNSVDKQFDNAYNLIYVLIGLMISLVGFVYWDRRTFSKPLEEKIIALEKENITNNVKNFPDLLKALKDLSGRDKELAQVLSKFNLL